MDGAILDVEIDLMPVCSNCHSMLHARRGKIMAINELKMLVEQVDGANALPRAACPLDVHQK